MTQRLDYPHAAPDGLKAMLGLEGYVRASGLEPALLELVKTRVSQINGWNRLSIVLRVEAGNYRPPAR